MALDAAGGGREAEVVLDRLSGLRGAPRRAAPGPCRGSWWSRVAGKLENGTHALVDLAHEALLRGDRRGSPYWKTFRDWVDQYRKQLEDRRLLEILAEKWHEGGRPRLSNVLTRGRQLRDFRRVGAAISDRAADFFAPAGVYGSCVRRDRPAAAPGRPPRLWIMVDAPRRVGGSPWAAGR